jgi:tetratricopeptide (TPR) repeat protein
MISITAGWIKWRSLAITMTVAFALAAVPATAGEALTPKSVPVQIKLAEAMAENEDWDEAIRRWIDILYYFGPSDADARAHFEIGGLLLRRGRSDLAGAQWEKTVRLHPESEYADRAREALRLLGKEPPSGPFEVSPPPVTEDTPEDERQLVVAEADLAVGLLEFAIRDCLKVPNLYPASTQAPQARFQAGICQALLGQPERAIAQWRRLQEDYPKAPETETAAGAIAAWEAVLKAAGTQPSLVYDDKSQRFAVFAIEPDRGLSYAEDLYENGVVDYALQEYAKVLCDVYTPKGERNPHRAYARYRMGVCAYELGRPDAAVRQWQRLIAEAPDSPWNSRAGRALSVLRADGLDVASLDLAPALPPDLSSSPVSRFALAEQLLDCGLPLIASKEYLKVIHVVTAGRPNPLQAEATYKLGVCHQRLGRLNLARKTWQRLVEQFPGSPAAEQARIALARAADLGELLASPYAQSDDPPS